MPKKIPGIPSVAYLYEEFTHLMIENGFSEEWCRKRIGLSALREARDLFVRKLISYRPDITNHIWREFRRRLLRRKDLKSLRNTIDRVIEKLEKQREDSYIFDGNLFSSYILQIIIIFLQMISISKSIQTNLSPKKK